jgi:hypothetical protein
MHGVDFTKGEGERVLVRGRLEAMDRGGCEADGGVTPGVGAEEVHTLRAPIALGRALSPGARGLPFSTPAKFYTKSGLQEDAPAENARPGSSGDQRASSAINR